MTSQLEMMRALLNDGALEVETLKTVGNALTAKLAVQRMADRAIELATEHGWICTRDYQGTISIETGHPSPASMLVTTNFYHVSDVHRRPSIEQKGLEVSSGGNTSLKRQYLSRLHLAVRLRDALQFINHQMKPRLQNDQFKVPTLEDFDLYEVIPVSDAELFNDDHFDGQGLWTRVSIPSANVTRVGVGDWHDLFKQLFLEHFDDTWIEQLSRKAT